MDIGTDGAHKSQTVTVTAVTISSLHQRIWSNYFTKQYPNRVNRKFS